MQNRKGGGESALKTSTNTNGRLSLVKHIEQGFLDLAWQLHGLLSSSSSNLNKWNRRKDPTDKKYITNWITNDPIRLETKDREGVKTFFWVPSDTTFVQPSAKAMLIA